MRRREFGSVRQLPSGRWQARYPGVDGRLKPAPEKFTSRQGAAGWFAALQTDLARGAWVDPARGREFFADYATEWLAHADASPGPEMRASEPGSHSAPRR